MPDQPHNTTALPIGRDDLEMAQDDIHMAQGDLHDILEKIIDALDNGMPLDEPRFQETMEHIKRRETEVGCLKHDLKRLHTQEGSGLQPHLNKNISTGHPR